MPTDEQLLQQARAGHGPAFRQLVLRYEGQVAATAIGMLGRSVEADDVGQETFVRFYRNLNRFRGDSSIGTYLTRIAINLSLNAIKRRQRQRQRFVSRDNENLVLDEPAVHEEHAADAADQAAVVRQAISRLSPDHRAVLVLRLVEGYSTRETADLLDVPVGTVLSRLSRAQRALKEILGPHLDEFSP